MTQRWSLKPTAVVVGVGAEQGLGAAVCRRFATEGYHVLVAGRTPAKIEQVARTIVARTTTLNQNGEPVQVSVGNLMVLRRPASSGDKHGS